MIDFPVMWRVGFHIVRYEACSVFTARYGPHAR
jgi:hypothetical protein